MGQQTSRPPVGEAGPRPSHSPHSPTHAWPRWASSLTQGLPPEGDRGLFRGEFILVQAPYAETIGRSHETQPRVSHLFRHQFRSHPMALPDTSATESLSRDQHQGMTRLYDHYHNRSMAADSGPVHLTVPQRRGFTKNLTPRLGHITEEEEEASLDDVTRRDHRDKDSGRLGDRQPKSRSVRRDKDGGDATDDDDYNEDDDDEASSGDEYSHRKRNRSAPREDGVPYHYFANHLVKPFFVTSQRYGSFQTMTARYKSSLPLPRPNVLISKSLPRPARHVDYGKPFRRGVTLTWRNRMVKSENLHSFEGPYFQHELKSRGGETTIYSQSPRSKTASEVMPEYELCHEYSPVLAQSPTVKSYQTRRPLSPVQDYSSSESGISDDYRIASKAGKKSSSRKGGTNKTSSSDESNRVYKRRKSSSADSAMRDFDLLSSSSSGDEDNNVFNSGSGHKSPVSPRSGGSAARSSPRSGGSAARSSPRSGGSAARSNPRRVSGSSSNSNSSTGVKVRQSVGRRGERYKSQVEETRTDNVSQTNNAEDEQVLPGQDNDPHSADEMPSAENPWRQLKSSLATDDYREPEPVTSPHNDSFLGANESRRRSMPYQDISLDSDYGDLNRTGKSSRSASHKSVAFADDTLDTSLADCSSKSLSRSLAEIINSSLTDGSYSSRKTISRSKSSPADPNHEPSPDQTSTQVLTDQVRPNINASFILQKSIALQKNGRSYSSDSFLSSPNCTENIKRLQDILIKQALPFARPDSLLSAQRRNTDPAETSLDHSVIGLTHAGDYQVPQRLHTPTQIAEKLNSHTSAPEKLNSHISVPEKFSSHTSAPEKLNSHTSTPEKLNSPAQLTEKLYTPTQVPENLNTLTRVPQRFNSPARGTEKLNTSTLKPEKLNTSTVKPEKLNISTVKTEKLNTSTLKPEKLNTSTLKPEKLNTSTVKTEKLNTSTQRSGKVPAKQQDQSKSDGWPSHQTAKQPPASQTTTLSGSDTDRSSVSNSESNLSSNEPALSLSQKPQQSSTIPPPPPPPPAPPLPASFNQSTGGAASKKLGDGTSKSNISIIKVNHKTSVKSTAVRDSQKTTSEAIKL